MRLIEKLQTNDNAAKADQEGEAQAGRVARQLSSLVDNFKLTFSFLCVCGMCGLCVCVCVCLLMVRPKN